MGEENQTILKEDLSDPKRRKASSFVVERMQAMRGRKLHSAL